MTALSLRQHGVRLRIIDKEQEWRQGSKGAVIQPRTLELYRLLAPDVLQDLLAKGTFNTLSRAYKPGTMEVLKEWHFSPPLKHTEAIPFVSLASCSADLPSFQ